MCHPGATLASRRPNSGPARPAQGLRLGRQASESDSKARSRPATTGQGSPPDLGAAPGGARQRFGPTGAPPESHLHGTHTWLHRTQRGETGQRGPRQRPGGKSGVTVSCGHVRPSRCREHRDAHAVGDERKHRRARPAHQANGRPIDARRRHAAARGPDRQRCLRLRAGPGHRRTRRSRAWLRQELSRAAWRAVLPAGRGLRGRQDLGLRRPELPVRVRPGGDRYVRDRPRVAARRRRRLRRRHDPVCRAAGHGRVQGDRARDQHR